VATQRCERRMRGAPGRRNFRMATIRSFRKGSIRNKRLPPEVTGISIRSRPERWKEDRTRACPARVNATFTLGSNSKDIRVNYSLFMLRMASKSFVCHVRLVAPLSPDLQRRTAGPGNQVPTVRR
jgi:hypothetical protein